MFVYNLNHREYLQRGYGNKHYNFNIPLNHQDDCWLERRDSLTSLKLHFWV